MSNCLSQRAEGQNEMPLLSGSAVSSGAWSPLSGAVILVSIPCIQCGCWCVSISKSLPLQPAGHWALVLQKSSIRRFVIMEKAPTRASSWLKATTTAFTFKTLLRHYAKRALTPRSLNVKLGPRRKGHKGRAVWLA